MITLLKLKLAEAELGAAVHEAALHTMAARVRELEAQLLELKGQAEGKGLTQGDRAVLAELREMREMKRREVDDATRTT